jgi:hypothetical protein
MARKTLMATMTQSKFDAGASITQMAAEKAVTEMSNSHPTADR